MTKRKIWLLISSSIILVLSGCWDQVDIEERGFVIGSAIDMAEVKNDGEHHLTLTNQFVVASAYGTPGSGGGGDQKAYANISASGDSMYTINNEMAQLTSRSPFFEHLKVIIVSNEVAQTTNLFADIMDIFLRNPEMRRGIRVVISEGDAKSLLDVKPPNEKLPVIYIESIMENSFRNLSNLEPVRIGAIHSYLLDENSYVVPRVVPSEVGIKYVGGAVFHGYDNKMIGIVDGEETMGLNLITGEAQEGTIEVEMNEQNVTFEMEELQSSLKINTKDKNNLIVSVEIDVDGTIGETFGTKSLLKKGIITEIEEKVSKKIEKLANQTIKNAQEELNADIFGIGTRLMQRHYDLWQEIENDWDRGENYFAKTKFHVSAKSNIRTTGATNQTKNKWSDR